MTSSKSTIHQHSKKRSKLLSYEPKDLSKVFLGKSFGWDSLVCLTTEAVRLSKRKFVFKVLKDSTIALEAHILHFNKLYNVASINYHLIV